MRHFRVFVLAVCLLPALLMIGCGKKPPAGPVYSTEGYGSETGACAACGKQSNHLLRISFQGHTGLVCSQACGDKFRANPQGIGEPETMGAVAGKCSVCGRSSKGLLRITANGRVATVCGPDCGDKFRANPAAYGTAETAP